MGDLVLAREDERARLRGVLAQVLRDADELDHGYLILVYGLGGIGKSELLRQYRKIILGESSGDEGFRGKFLLATVDWEQERQRRPADYPPAGPLLWRALGTIYGAISAVTDDVKDQRRIERAFERFREHAAAAQAAAAQVAGNGAVSQEKAEFLARSENLLVHAFADGVREVSREVRPLVLSLRAAEILGDIRVPFYDLIRLSGRRVIWLLGMRMEPGAADRDPAADGPHDPISALYLKQLPSSRLRAVSPTRFTTGDIAEYLIARMGAPGPDGSTAEAIVALTAGIPLAAQLAVDLLRRGCRPEDLVLETSPQGTASGLVSRLAVRYVAQLSAASGREPDPDLDLILGMALLSGNQTDPDVLAALWDVAPGGVAACRQALGERHQFLSGGGLGLHQDVRDAIRGFLLRPEQRARVRPANERATKVLRQQLDSLGITNIESQLASAEWCSALTALLWHTLWQDSAEGLRLLSSLLPAAQLIRPEFALVLLRTTDYFAAVLPEEPRRVVAGLHVLVPAAPPGRRLRALAGKTEYASNGRVDSRALAAAVTALREGSCLASPVLASDAQADALLDLLTARNPDSFGIHSMERLDLIRQVDSALPAAQRVPLLSRAVTRCAVDLAAELWRSISPEQDLLQSLLAATDIAVRRDGRSPEAWYFSGLVLQRGGQSKDAVAAYDRALSLRPGDAATYYNKGVALERLGLDAEALAAYDQAASLRPDAATHYGRGNALRRLGRDADALAAYDQALSLRPGDAATLHNKGFVLGRLGRYEDALAAYDQSLSLRPGDAATQHNKGAMLERLGRDTDALAAYDQALSLRPDDADAHYGRGNALRRLGRDDEALAAYDQAVSLRPADAATHHNMGFVLRRLGRYEDALAAYDRALSLRPDGAATEKNKGVVLERLGRDSEALAAYDRALSLRPGDAATQKNKGVVLERLGRDADALAAYDQAIDLRPGDADAHYGRGNALRRLGRDDDALAAYDQAVSLRPGDAATQHNKGFVLGRLGRDEEALAAYDQAVSLRPGNADSHYGRGNTLWRLGRDEEALAAYDQAISLRPGDAATHHNKGFALEHLGRDEEALAAYDQAIRLRPGDADTHHNKGVVLEHLGRDADALAAYDQALSLRPDDADTHYGRGNTLWHLGRDADALAAYDQALSLRPDDADTQHNKGVVLERLGRDEDALAAYDEAIRLRPDDAATQHNKGFVLRRLGRYEDALAAYDQVISLRPDDVATHASRGDSLLLLGRYDEARTALRSAIHPADDEAVEARVLLAVLLRGTDPAEARELCSSALPCIADGLSEFRQGELRALAHLMLGQPADAEAQLRAVAQERTSADLFEEQVYDLLRDPPVDGLAALLAIWTEVGGRAGS